VLRILLCGDDSTGRATLNRRLTDASQRVCRFIAIRDASDPKRSTLRLASEAMASDAAIVVVDAGVGVTVAARRQVLVLHALGLGRIVFAINKMDLVEYAREAFAHIERECHRFAAGLGSSEVRCVPVSALHSQNISERTPKMAWYSGWSLVDSLGSVPLPGQVETAGDITSAHQFEATIVWTADRPMLQSRSYLMTIGNATVPATVSPLKYRIDTRTFLPTPAKTLDCGDVGICNLDLGEPIPFDHGRPHFTLVGHPGGETVGIGRLHFALYRSQNVRWQSLDINKSARAALMSQKPCVVWFTGLSGAGKSTIANLVEKRLHALGRHTYLLDGDNVRHGLNKDLGFTDADRVENIRRVAEVARLMVDAGLVVLVSFISPFRSERRMARTLFGDGEFVEVFVDTPLDVAESRDPKGLYRKARRGDLKNFTGVDSPYEVPEHADLRLDTTRLSAEDSALAVLHHLERAGIVR
jgi:adenylyl-sulfate kinase